MNREFLDLYNRELQLLHDELTGRGYAEFSTSPEMVPVEKPERVASSASIMSDTLRTSLRLPT